MRRFLSLFGYIFSTVFLFILTTFGAVLIALNFENVGEFFNENSILIYVILGAGFLLLLITLLLNAAAISTWNKTPEVYRKKSALIIATIVFNFILIVLIALALAWSITSEAISTSILVIVLEGVLLFVLLLTNIFAFVDLGREGKRIRKVKNAVVGQVGTAPVKVENASFETKLERLISLREQGLITKAEFDELKLQIVKEKISKK